MKKLFNYLTMLLGIVVFSSCANYSIDGKIDCTDEDIFEHIDSLDELDAEVFVYSFDGKLISKLSSEKGKFKIKNLSKEKYLVVLRYKEFDTYIANIYKLLSEYHEILEDIFTSNTEYKGLDEVDLLYDTWKYDEWEHKDKSIENAVNRYISTLRDSEGVLLDILKPVVDRHYFATAIELYVIDFNTHTSKNFELIINLCN